MPTRRYDDSEIAEIFKRATEKNAAVPNAGAQSSGLSLVELQQIGQEVDIPQETVALAAQSLDLVAPKQSQTLLGLPIGVGHTVELDRQLSDAEWDQLVVRARETFRARGTIRTDGAFKQWTNGNLQMLLEPTEQGHRIRLRTYNANSRMMIMSGSVFLGIAGVMTMLGIMASEGLAEVLAGVAFILAAGIGMVALGAARLPRWARLRRKQMESLAAGLKRRDEKIGG